MYRWLPCVCTFEVVYGEMFREVAFEPRAHHYCTKGCGNSVKA
jgi:hypothetical protein